MKGGHIMGLSFFYEFTASANTSALELEKFLRDVEHEAKSFGFNPTIVLNVPFDTPEQREFANRLGGNFTLQDERLKGVAIPAPRQLRNHDLESGECRLFPERGVVLVVTDERGCEACFGFFKLPEQIIDIHSAILADTGLQCRWWFRDFVNSPDPRYRTIVRRFATAGYVKNMSDDFARP
jgi:hypothetical protein